MKRLLAAVLVLLVTLPLAWFFALRSETRQLARAQLEGAAALRAKVIPLPTKQPMHENGFSCLAKVASVTPRDVGPFTVSAAGSRLGDVTRGATPVTALSETDSEAFSRLAPWAESMRNCASAAKLQLVEPFLPDAPEEATARQQVSEAIDSFVLWQGLELRKLLADQAPAELVLQRCSGALALAADLTHLGTSLHGAGAAKFAVYTWAPLCAEALATTTPEQRAIFAKGWASLPARVAPRAELVRWVRAGQASWFVARPPESGESFLDALARERRWKQWDAALVKLEAVADGDAASREPALTALKQSVEATHDGHHATGVAVALRETQEVETVLTLLLSIAMNDASPRPDVKREGGVLEYAPAQGAPISLVLPKE